MGKLNAFELSSLLSLFELAPLLVVILNLPPQTICQYTLTGYNKVAINFTLRQVVGREQL